MGYRVLDLYPLYQAVLRQRGWADLSPWWRSVKPLDGHPNAEGHRFIAQRLLDYILADAELSATLGMRAGGAGDAGTERGDP